MEFLGMDWHVWVILAILWACTVVYVRRKREGDSLFAKLFQSNKDLDTTLALVLRGVVTIAVLIIMLMFFSMFHDDLDQSDVGMLASQIVGMGALVLNNIMDNKPKHPNGNGDTPKETKEKA